MLRPFPPDNRLGDYFWQLETIVRTQKQVARPVMGFERKLMSYRKIGHRSVILRMTAESVNPEVIYFIVRKLLHNLAH